MKTALSEEVILIPFARHHLPKTKRKSGPVADVVASAGTAEQKQLAKRKRGLSYCFGSVWDWSDRTAKAEVNGWDKTAEGSVWGRVTRAAVVRTVTFSCVPLSSKLHLLLLLPLFFPHLSPANFGSHFSPLSLFLFLTWLLCYMQTGALCVFPPSCILLLLLHGNYSAPLHSPACPSSFSSGLRPVLFNIWWDFIHKSTSSTSSCCTWKILIDKTSRKNPRFFKFALTWEPVNQNLNTFVFKNKFYSFIITPSAIARLLW